MNERKYCVRCGFFHDPAAPCYPNGKPEPDKSVQVPEFDLLSEGCDPAKCAPVEYHTYTATHSAWFLFCPILLADLQSEAPVPIPRRFIPFWWFDFNFWLNDPAQWVISWFAPAAVGYMFYRVKELPEPKTIKVPAA